MDFEVGELGDKRVEVLVARAAAYDEDALEVLAGVSLDAGEDFAVAGGEAVEDEVGERGGVSCRFFERDVAVGDKLRVDALHHGAR